MLAPGNCALRKMVKNALRGKSDTVMGWAWNLFCKTTLDVVITRDNIYELEQKVTAVYESRKDEFARRVGLEESWRSRAEARVVLQRWLWGSEHQNRVIERARQQAIFLSMFLEAIQRLIRIFRQESLPGQTTAGNSARII